jgi:hypothetical protein
VPASAPGTAAAAAGESKGRADHAASDRPAPRRRKDAGVAESYYAARSRRDPEWRREQLAGAREREQARRERDPEAFKAARREATRRCRERQAAGGLTFDESRLREPAHLLVD